MSDGGVTTKTAGRQQEQGAGFTLHLYGPARLSYQGRHVTMRRKGLALLYYLALEGSSRREVLADILWGHSTANRNLRVEIYNLRQTFAAYNMTIFEDSGDILHLPSYIRLDNSNNQGELLEGLEDTSPDFQLWLERQRMRYGHADTTFSVRDQLVSEVASKVKLPYLLILAGQPGSGQLEFAQSLAQALGLPFIEGAGGQSRAVRYLNDAQSNQSLPMLRERILHDQQTLWVIGRPAFGEDPLWLLELRNAFPAQRLRYLTLPPLSWLEARRKLLQDIPFGEAAQLYLKTHGNLDFLRELMALRPEGGFGGDHALPVPQRIRAAYQLEARRLDIEARLTLDRLSVHPGELSEDLLNDFDAEPHLDELERRGWLVFEDAWHFANETARRVIYGSLQQGRRRRYHMQAVTHFASVSNHVAEAYHRQCIGESIDGSALLTKQADWAYASLEAWLGIETRSQSKTDEPLRVPVEVGKELALLETQRFGSNVEVDGGRVVIVRTPDRSVPSGVEWELPSEPFVLRIQGRAQLENSLGIGLNGRSLPLLMEFIGPSSYKKLVLAKTAHPHLLNDNGWLLPLTETFDYHVYMADHQQLRLESLAEFGVFELELSLYRPAAMMSDVTSAFSLRSIYL